MQSPFNVVRCHAATIMGLFLLVCPAVATAQSSNSPGDRDLAAMRWSSASRSIATGFLAGCFGDSTPGIRQAAFAAIGLVAID
jgi:hypothetical protein